MNAGQLQRIKKKAKKLRDKNKKKQEQQEVADTARAERAFKDRRKRGEPRDTVIQRMKQRAKRIKELLAAGC